MTRQTTAVVAVVAALLAGCAATERVTLEAGRPRLFLKAAPWPGGPSVDQLRQRVTQSPFKERAHLLRTTLANLSLKWLIEDGSDTGEKAARECLDGMRKWNRGLQDSEDGTQLIDLALAYDWLFTWKGFSDENKRAVEEKMVAAAKEMEAQLSGRGAHIFHTRMYSWMGGVGLAGLALHDRRPEGRDLFLFAKRYYEERLVPARQLQGGTMHNGPLYALNYMMFPTLQFLKAAQSAAGIDYFHTADPARSDWLRETVEFMVYITRPDLKTVRYADLTTQVPDKHFRYALDILGAEYRDGHAAHLANLISERYKTSGYHAEWIYLFHLFHDPTVAPKPFDDLPTFRVMGREGTGHAFFRSDWSKDATVVHFRCGDYFDDHGHFDQGSFTIFKRAPLAMKTGFYDFASPHRLHYFKQAISTNTVIFNDTRDTMDEGRQRNVRYQEAVSVEDYLAHKTGPESLETGNILAVDDPAFVSWAGKDVHAVSADVTPAWDPKKVKRYLRHLAFVSGKYLVVVDDTETTGPEVRARWLLHSSVEPRTEGGVWTVRLPDSVLYVQSLLPERPKVTLIGGPGRECEVNGVNWTYLTADKFMRYNKNVTKPLPDLGLWRMELEHGEAAARRLFVTVLTATDPFKPPPPVKAARTPAGLVVEVDAIPVTFHTVGAEKAPQRPGETDA